MILNEIQEEKGRKKVKEKDAKQTEANEVQVILNGLTTTSKKRAFSASSFIDHWMDTALRSTPPLP